MYRLWPALQLVHEMCHNLRSGMCEYVILYQNKNTVICEHLFSHVNVSLLLLLHLCLYIYTLYLIITIVLQSHILNKVTMDMPVCTYTSFTVITLTFTC